MDGPVVLPAPLSQGPLFSRTPVHAQESNVANPPASTEIEASRRHRIETNWRHRRWAGRREQVRQAMESGFPAARKTAFNICGCWCVVERSPSTQRVRLRGNYCHDRFCEPCGRARANRIARNLTAHLQEGHLAGKQFRLITLTITHSRSPLSKQVDHLLKSFRSLRQTKAWQCAINGGAAFVEVKVSESGEWHPHLHVITEGRYLSQTTLAREWHRITKTSYVVDIRMVRDLGEAAAYVCKYASNPLDLTVFSEAPLLQEAMRALGGRRLCTTIGSWRGFKLEAKPEDPKDWAIVWTLAQFLVLLNSRDETAVRFCRDNKVCEDALDEQQDLFFNTS